MFLILLSVRIFNCPVRWQNVYVIAKVENEISGKAVVFFILFCSLVAKVRTVESFQSNDP